MRPRSGVVALTALAALAVTGTGAVASAAPVPAPVTPAITNQANASSQQDGHTDWVLKYQFQHASAATLNVTNHATATASQCHDCTADGIAFQVVLASKQNLVTLNADNKADAVSSNCVRCSTFAGAYQIIYASDQRQLSRYQIQGLNHVHAELIALQFTGLKGAALQARTDAIAQEAVGVLANGPNPIPFITPAIDNSGNAAELTQDNGPFIDLFVKHAHQGG